MQTEAQILADYAALQAEKYDAGMIAGGSKKAAIAYACMDLRNQFRTTPAEYRLATMADEVAFARECFNRRKAA